MKYQGIRKIHEGRFITRYDVDYVTAEGNPKTYEMISRDGNIQSLEDLQNKTPNAVVMILTDESGERILVNREYRMAMAQWIYNFPAGLIDPGESAEESAKRELWEETGLRLMRIDDVLDNSYSAVGFSNERNVCVFGVAEGEFHKSTSDAEEITPGWYTKANSSPVMMWTTSPRKAIQKPMRSSAGTAISKRWMICRTGSRTPWS